MHLFDLKPTKKILLLFILLSSFIQIQAQNLSIQFSPLDAVCNYDSINCAASVNYPFSIVSSNEENLSLTYQVILEGQTPEDDINGEIMGIFPSFSIDGTYPLGNHAFLLNADDGVENSIDTLFFSVVNCLLPVVECIQGRVVTLGDPPQPDGYCDTPIWANDFIESVTPYCTDNFTYTIHFDEDVIDGTDIPNNSQTGLLVDCSRGVTVVLRIYTWDNAFNPYSVQPDSTIGGSNYSYCLTYILIQEGINVPHCCETYDPVEGSIITEENDGIVAVEVTISSNNGEESSTTGNDGFYNTTLSNEVQDLTITPRLDSFPLNGATSFDIILIAKHILGVQSLGSPYKLIAADVNNSGTITTADLIQLRKLILSIYDDFPDNTSWRFVDADYTFPDSTNPWAEIFPESIHDNYPFDLIGYNFIGIKIGDVNGSVIPNNE